QRVSRRRREPEPLDRDVEIEVVRPRAELDRIDQPQIGVDSERRQVLEEWHMVGLRRRLVDQELDGEGLAVGGEALAVFDRRPGGAAMPCAAARGPVPSRPIPAARTAPRTPRPEPSRGTAPAASAPPPPACPAPSCPSSGTPTPSGRTTRT